MGSSHIRDVLTSFSPNLDLFAISPGDGRIKVRLFSCFAFLELKFLGRDSRIITIVSVLVSLQYIFIISSLELWLLGKPFNFVIKSYHTIWSLMGSIHKPLCCSDTWSI